MRKVLFIVLVYVLLVLPSIALADKKPCYTTFYQTEKMSCVYETLPLIKKQRAVNPTMVGYFSELFKLYPKQIKAVLKKSDTPIIKSTMIEALYRAGVQAQAKAYAKQVKLGKVFDQLQAKKAATIDEIRPAFIPADNDLLIGAYMVSGASERIEVILNGTTKIPSSILHDVFRVSFMQQKFGPGLTPKDRGAVMAKALCFKYECKKDIKYFMHIMTLSSGIWMINSLAKTDENIKAILKAFLDKHKEVKKVFLYESTSFSNYLTMYVGIAMDPDNKPMQKFLITYEKLGSSDQLNKLTKQLLKKD
jgi:hypothetical protein